MVANKVLNGHLKTIRGIVVKSFVRTETKLDSIDMRLKNIEKTLGQGNDEVKTEHVSAMRE